MFSTTTARLLAGTALVGSIVLAAGAPVSAATPPRHRFPAEHRTVVRATPTGVTLGTAVAYVEGPGGTPIAVAPTSLP